MKANYTARKFFNDIHLWMGLASGIVLFIVCLSGTIYTFRSEIERTIDASKYYVKEANGQVMLPADSLVSSIEKKYNGKATSIVVPADASMTWQISIKKNTVAVKKTKPETAPRPSTYFVDPYTGAITGTQGGSTSEFFTKVMQLHRWLLMEDSGGKIIVGVATIIFVFLILSGLIIWFPVNLRYWRQGLKIKTNANWKRVNHDLHATLGFYSFLLLLVMSLTGLCWSFEWYKNGVSTVLGSKVFKGRGEKPLQSKGDINTVATIATFLSQTHELFPYKGNCRLTIAEDSVSAVVVTKTPVGFFAVAAADKVQYDRFTGQALKVEKFADKRFNVQIADSIRAIHTGEIFGTFSKILYCIACLIATSLPVTGTMIWLNKMKKKQPSPKVIMAQRLPI